MLYIIGFLLFAFVVIAVVSYLIDHSPSGWEDENGFHTSTETAPQLSRSINQFKPNIELSFGKVAGSLPLR
jgi:hypothetical protein